MTKYLLLYRAPVSASDQMAGATPEQAQAGMDAWMGWAGRVGSALTDMGAPCQYAGTVGATYPASEGFIGATRSWRPTRSTPRRRCSTVTRT